MGNTVKKYKVYIKGGFYTERKNELEYNYINIFCDNKLRVGSYPIYYPGFVWIKSRRGKYLKDKIITAFSSSIDNITEVHIIKPSTLKRDKEKYIKLSKQKEVLVVVCDGVENVFRKKENEEEVGYIMDNPGKGDYALLPQEEE